MIFTATGRLSRSSRASQTVAMPPVPRSRLSRYIHGVFRDPEPKSSRMLEWLSQWEDWRVEAEEYIPAGEFVVVLCRYTGRG